MNQELLDHKIEEWEREGTVVRTIDTHDDTVERIIRRRPYGTTLDLYTMYRYFTLGTRPDVLISVDLDDVDADRVIQHLAERL